jgi:hypothetical protein
MADIREHLAGVARYARAEQAVRIWNQREKMMSSTGTSVFMPDEYPYHFANLSLKQANGILAEVYGFDSDEAFDKWLRRGLPPKIQYATPGCWDWNLYELKPKPVCGW